MTIIRAARVVAAGLGCQLFSIWERRRSSIPSCIADDLTHNLFRELSSMEVEVLLTQGHVQFPQPILEWMSMPEVDPDLGTACLEWIKDNNYAVDLLS